MGLPFIPTHCPPKIFSQDYPKIISLYIFTLFYQVNDSTPVQYTTEFTPWPEEGLAKKSALRESGPPNAHKFLPVAEKEKSPVFYGTPSRGKYNVVTSSKPIDTLEEQLLLTDEQPSTSGIESDADVSERRPLIASKIHKVIFLNYRFS